MERGCERDELSRRLLIIKWSNQTKMVYSHYTCNENIRQRTVHCPTCEMLLNVPVQTCLVRTATPIAPRSFRKYKRSITSFSKMYQVIRIFLLVQTPF